MVDLASAIGSRYPDRRPWVIAALLSIDTTANRAKVSIDGSDSVSLPFVPGNYTGVNTVFVLRDFNGSGCGDVVFGPCYTMPVPPPPPPPEPPPPSQQETDPPQKAPVLDTALIRPTWSGTYRSGGPFPGWDQWNVGRYGGRSSLYQGNAYGSGPLKGLATYGNQVKALGALQIKRIVVATPLVTGSGSVVLQGSPHASKPAGSPSSSGATSSGATSVDLADSICEAFRTGAAKGLVCVGGSYRATYGTSRANGMALSITYTRPA